MDEKLNQSFELVKKYRKNLITYGKRFAFENPDRLNIDQLKAVSLKTLQALDELDMSMGYAHYEISEKIPASVSKDELEELYIDFLDWYQIVPSPSQNVYQYVTQHFPVEKYPKILCVGDGSASHLGRKFAMQGYTAISVDPRARKELSGIKDSLEGYNGRKHGKFRALPLKFLSTSVNMIDWADVIVGSKVPECVEHLVKVKKKPVVFNISMNPERYGMFFNGVPIRSYEQFVKEIAKCPGVIVEEQPCDLEGKSTYLFIKNERLRERNLEDK